VGEVAGGEPTGLTLELATLAADLASRLGGEASVLLVDGAAETAAPEVARHGPDVYTARPSQPSAPAAAGIAAVAASLIADRAPDIVLIGGTREGRDVAGSLVGLSRSPILVSASGVDVEDGSVAVRRSTFGGRVITRNAFRDGGGIIIVEPGTVAARPAASPGAIDEIDPSSPSPLPAVEVVDHVDGAVGGASIDDADVIVGAGRGVGGPAGMVLLEELAGELGGAVGGTRAAVDAGWLEFAQQIGQTGKTVRPDLYIACGVSGAIQHRVGIQSAGTIIAIEQDREAPIAGFADVLILGDLLEVVPRLTRALREARTGPV
jgi:electron transfer flavoprotein alpha subunit